MGRPVGAETGGAVPVPVTRGIVVGTAVAAVAAWS